MTTEKQFLAWINKKTDEAARLGNEAALKIICDTKEHYTELFRRRLEARTPHEIIEICLAEEGLFICDLSDRSKHKTVHKYRAIKKMMKSFPYPVSQHDLANILGIDQKLISVAVNSIHARDI